MRGSAAVAAGVPGFRAHHRRNAFIDLSLVLFPSSFFFSFAMKVTLQWVFKINLERQTGGESKNRESGLFLHPGWWRQSNPQHRLCWNWFDTGETKAQ